MADVPNTTNGFYTTSTGQAKVLVSSPKTTESKETQGGDPHTFADQRSL